MKPREYCCCAIPIIYAGIYATILEQLVLGVVAGTLSIATPSIVGASTPSFAKWIFAVIAWTVGAVQVLGLVAVRQERPVFYRRYITLHLLTTVAAFGVAAAWIAISATRHTQAQNQCINDFYKNTVSATNGQGETLCNIFPWADVGIMGRYATYLYVVLSSFGKGQRRDHIKYQSLVSDSAKSLNNIPLVDRGGAWESRQSTENLVQPGGHIRHDSNASVATVMGDKVQTYSDNYAAFPPNPPNVYTQEPGPTPHAYDNYYSTQNTYGAGVGYPERSQAHPGES
ncbi:hypothetical protein C8Q74DRAFT_1314298 [Fomes fomentarius]|nr:hypothetical protein C8Q74DRAFT_1314298 [Fomes fomentarius]